MQIRKLTAHLVRLPFKQSFKHASAERESSDNVIIRCELADGTTGWGEGVPRPYVTGETPEGCLAQLAATAIAEQLVGECHDWPSVIALLEQFRPVVDRDDLRGRYGNALRCAVELSILDAFGRLFDEPLSNVAQYYAPAQRVLAAEQHSFLRYSAIIDAGNRHLVRKALVRRLYGFHHCKVKVGTAGDDDIARLRTIRRWMGPRVDLRIDANEAWHPEELVSRLRALSPFQISCVEQPLPHAEVTALTELRPQLPMPVMLDESLTSDVDARAAITHRTCDLFNLRLSKCGGFLACLRLAALARAAGIEFQLGCHPGESGILSAAGRHWASIVDKTRYLEGSYDRFLFRRLLTHEDITFGYGGSAPALAGPGLGVTVKPAAIDEVNVKRQEFSIA
jgi:muconate cycloisomerase